MESDNIINNKFKNIVEECYSYKNSVDKKEVLTSEFFDEGIDEENREIFQY